MYRAGDRVLVVRVPEGFGEWYELVGTVVENTPDRRGVLVHHRDLTQASQEGSRPFGYGINKFGWGYHEVVPRIVIVP